MRESLEDVSRVHGGTQSTVDEGVVFVRIEPESMFTFAQHPEDVAA